MGVGHEVRRIVTVHKPISIAIRSSTSRFLRDRQEAKRVCTSVHTRACRRVNSSANTCGSIDSAREALMRSTRIIVESLESWHSSVCPTKHCNYKGERGHE